MAVRLTWHGCKAKRTSSGVVVLQRVVVELLTSASRSRVPVEVVLTVVRIILLMA